MPTDNQWAKQALIHARFLTEQIGPRGAATPEEKHAAEYARDQLQQIGVSDARVDAFRSPRSAWLPLTILFSMAVWGSVLCWGGFYLTQVPAIGAIIGAVLCAFSAWTLYRIAIYHDHPFRRWLSNATSHNAVGHIAATGEAVQRVVLVANLDTYPDSWIFRTRRRTRLAYGLLRLAAISLIVSVVMYVLGALQVWDFAFVSAAVCGLIQSVGVLLTIQADQGEYSVGANDNASGIGTILALARRLRETPLTHTEVWIVGAGSHTLDGGGLRWFMQQQPALAKTAWFIGCQRVGRGDHWAIVRREGWLPRSIRAKVRALIAQATVDRPEMVPRFIATTRATVIGSALWRGRDSLCVEVVGNGGGHGELQTTALSAAQQGVWLLLQTVDG